MNIKRLSCSNIKTFENFDMEPGAVTVVSGQNAGGKTSLLSLVVGLFGKGNPRMLRAGAESGHICAVLEGENETLEVRRDFIPGKVKTAKVKSNRTGNLGAGAEYLASLMDPISVDPINRAMNASEDEQTRILLDTMPMQLDGNALFNAVDPLSALKLPNLPAILKSTAGMNGMDAAKAVEDYVYEQRTLVNRDERLKRAHAMEMLAALPYGVNGAEDWAAKVVALDTEIAEVANSEKTQEYIEARRHAKAKEDATATAKDALEVVETDVHRQIRALEKQIAALETQRVEAKAAINETLAGELAKLNEENTANVREISDRYRPQHADLAAKKATAAAYASDQTRMAEVKRISAEASSQADALKAKSALMTTSLKAVEDVRAAMLENLPIKGLMVQGGIVYLDGVPLSERNTAERAKFWIRVAAMRAGELGIIALDGCECFDPETFAKVVDSMRRTGLQWFVARVDGGDFKVETFSEIVTGELVDA